MYSAAAVQLQHSYNTCVWETLPGYHCSGQVSLKFQGVMRASATVAVKQWTPLSSNTPRIPHLGVCTYTQSRSVNRLQRLAPVWVHQSWLASLSTKHHPEGNVPPLLCRHTQHTHISHVRCARPSVRVPLFQRINSAAMPGVHLQWQEYARAASPCSILGPGTCPTFTQLHLSIGKFSPQPACSVHSTLDIFLYIHFQQHFLKAGMSLQCSPPTGHLARAEFIGQRAPFDGAGLRPEWRGCAHRWPGSVQTAPGRTRQSA